MGIFDRLTGRVGGIFGDFIEEVRISDEVHTLLQRAAQEYELGHYDAALDILATIRTNSPLARVHHLRGMCHFQRGFPQEAARELRRAIELKEQPQSHLWAALAFEQIHEWRAAQDHLLRALQLEQSGQASSSSSAAFRGELHETLGRIYLRLGRADKAIKELKKGMRLQERDVSASLTLAEALHERGQDVEAMAAMAHADVERSGDVHAHLVHARIAEALDEDSAALDAYRRAVRHADAHPKQVTNSQLVEALLGAARLAIRAGQLDLASTSLAKASSQLSASALGASYHVLRASLARSSQDMVEAARAYEQALSQDPTHAEALLGAAQLAALATQYERALELFAQVLAMPGHKLTRAALLGQGMARRALGDLSGARQVLEEAQRLESRAHDVQSAAAQTRRRNRAPHHTRLGAEIALELARVELDAGDHARALMNLREIFEDAPEELAPLITQVQEDALKGLEPRLDLPADLEDPLKLERALGTLRTAFLSDSRLSDFLPEVQRILDALSAPLSVAIVGEFNAGKSTLINALMGVEILPTGVLPTTAHTGIVQYGPRQAARVVWRGEEEPVEVSFKEARRLMKDNGEAIDHLQYLAPFPELRAMHFWDTPGFNALEERHEDVARQALEEAEAILWMMDANQVLSQSEFERIQNIPSGEERLIVIINKIDRLGPHGEREDDVSHLIDYVTGNAGKYIAGCYPVSALEAQQAQRARSQASVEAQDDPAFVSHIQTQLVQSGLTAFQEHLQQKIVQRAGRIKTIEGQRHLGVLLDEVARHKRAILDHYTRQLATLSELGEWIDGLQHGRPRRVAGFELMELEDGVEFMWRAITREIDEALHPSSSWVSRRLVLNEEDRDYLIQLIEDRFSSLLAASRDRVLHDVRTIEAELAERVGPLLGAMALQDARALGRRLEGFQDEVGVLKLLLEERVYGRLMARARGQVEAAAGKVLEEIARVGSRDEDVKLWKGMLRPLIPSLKDGLSLELEQWYATFIESAERFCARARADLELLELEVEWRLDFGKLRTLLPHGATTREPA